MTQEKQVILAMQQLGGCATLSNLNGALDFSTWKTKTPEATVRRIVQESPAFFKIRPGFWALNELRDTVLERLKLSTTDDEDAKEFSHSYFQGLIVEIGNYKGLQTFIPGQDKNRLFIDKPLKALASAPEIYQFSYEKIINRAKTVDVIWFNERFFPDSFFEVEHTTDIQNSLIKFTDLQDFFAKFYIVADEYRHRKFDEIIDRSAFKDIRQRVKFINYDNIANQHMNAYKAAQSAVI